MSFERQLARMAKAKMPVKRHLTQAKLDTRVKRLERQQRGAKRAIFTDVDDADVFLTPLVDVIDTVSGGGGESYLNQIWVKGEIVHAVDAVGSHLTRIVLVRDKANSDPDNDEPGWTDVFREAEIFAHRALDTSQEPDQRFVIIADRIYKTEKDTDGTSNSRRFFSIKKNYKGLHTIMDGTASRGRKNGFYLMLMSTAVTTQIDVSYSIMVTYTSVAVN